MALGESRYLMGWLMDNVIAPIGNGIKDGVGTVVDYAGHIVKNVTQWTELVLDQVKKLDLDELRSVRPFRSTLNDTHYDLFQMLSELRYA